MLKYFLLVSIIFSVQLSFARQWQEITVPGAYCGDGKPYAVYLDQKSEKNLVIEFMSGGACWDAETCFGPNFRAWLHPAKISGTPSALADDRSPQIPVADHTYLYFPYCTGDVYAGNSVVYYKKNTPTYHFGRVNVQKAFAYLNQKNLINFSETKNILVWGISAGAIGAIAHLNSIDKYLPSQNINKVIIADSPGLHFGEKFFDKFSDQYFQDLYETFENVNIYIKRDKGLIADSLSEFYYTHPNWQIGILQATKDIIMSAVFGNISPTEHSKLVLGPNGIINKSFYFSNAHTWVMDSYMHSFLMDDRTAKFLNMDKSQTALDFTNQVYLTNFLHH